MTYSGFLEIGSQALAIINGMNTRPATAERHGHHQPFCPTKSCSQKNCTTSGKRIGRLARDHCFWKLAVTGVVHAAGAGVLPPKDGRQ
jgi:hypothetical protein